MYRDEQEPLQSRVRTLEAELEAERRLRQAAETEARASRAAGNAAAAAARRSDEETASGASTPLWRRGAVVVALLGSTMILGAGLLAARTMREQEHGRAGRYQDQLHRAEAQLRRTETELGQQRKLRETAVAQLHAQAAASAPAVPPEGDAAPTMTGNGSLDRGAIQRVIHMSAVRACYERRLLAKPGLEGRVVVEFVIAPGGRVSSAKVGESTLADQEVSACLLRVARTWVFPAPAGGSVSVRYAFGFRAS